MGTEKLKKMRIGSYFIRQKPAWKTTWLGKLAIGLFLILLMYGGRGFLLDWATSFVAAKDTTSPADAIVIENWSYPSRMSISTSFQLLSNGFGRSIFITEYSFSNSHSITGIESSPYYNEILDLYFKGEGFDFAKVKKIHVELKDPVTWNTAVTVIEILAAQGYHSMILVSPWYHSRRSCNAYTKIGKQKGVAVFCKPYEEDIMKDNWWKFHSGLSTVFDEIMKQIYYLFKIT